jgi:hypothetical protein
MINEANINELLLIVTSGTLFFVLFSYTLVGNDHNIQPPCVEIVTTEMNSSKYTTH